MIISRHNINFTLQIKIIVFTVLEVNSCSMKHIWAVNILI